MKVLIVLGAFLLAGCDEPPVTGRAMSHQLIFTPSTEPMGDQSEFYYDGEVTLPNGSVASFTSYHTRQQGNQIHEEEVAFSLKSNQPNDRYILRAVFREGAMIGSSSCLYSQAPVQCTRIADSPDSEIREKGDRALWVAYRAISLFMEELFKKEDAFRLPPKPISPEITYTT